MACCTQGLPLLITTHRVVFGVQHEGKGERSPKHPEHTLMVHILVFEMRERGGKLCSGHQNMPHGVCLQYSVHGGHVLDVQQVGEGMAVVGREGGVSVREGRHRQHIFDMFSGCVLLGDMLN